MNSGEALRLHVRGMLDNGATWPEAITPEVVAIHLPSLGRHAVRGKVAFYPALLVDIDAYAAAARALMAPGSQLLAALVRLAERMLGGGRRPIARREGLQLLVPGSGGLRGLLLLLDGHGEAAGQVLGQAALRAMSLSLGALAAQAVVTAVAAARARLWITP